MRTILKNGRGNRLAFQFGRQTGLRSASDVIDQLQVELAAERAQVAELERGLAVLSKELLEARLELAKRRVADAFAAMPSPSVMMH
jgi:septum formation topological specificity factor MinE